MQSIKRTKNIDSRGDDIAASHLVSCGIIQRRQSPQPSPFYGISLSPRPNARSFLDPICRRSRGASSAAAAGMNHVDVAATVAATVATTVATTVA